jgi:hypothetical protein
MSEGTRLAANQQVNIHFSMANEESQKLSKGIFSSFLHKRSVSAIKRTEFVNVRMLYIMLRGR